MTPVFSFVIPVCGTEDLLPRCLDSILSQGDAEFEVVVVDDCSPGNCKEVIKGYGDRISYVRHDRNRSLLQARISGAREAKGKYVVHVDSDDYVRPGLVAALKDAVSDDDDIIVYQSESDSSGVIAPVWHNHAACRMSGGELFAEIRNGKAFWTMWGKALKRDVYLAAIDWTGINDDFYLNNTEDLFQMYPMTLLAKGVRFVEFPGYRYWINPTSMTKRIGSYERMEPRARQCQKCLDVLEAASRRHGVRNEDVELVRSMIRPTVKWFLEELRHLSPVEWSRCVNMLCKIHGMAIVCSIAQSIYDDFYERFEPNPELFPQPKSGPVKNVAIICLKRSGGGAERATGIWARQVQKLGVKVTWMPDRAFDEGSQWALDENLTKRAEELRFNLEDRQIDTVLLVDHWRNRCFFDLLVAKMSGCRIIVAEHSSYFFPLDDLNPELFVGREHFYRLADVVTVLSLENQAWWRARGFSNAVYMPNFLTFEGIGRAERKLEPPYDLVFVGRICERKNANLALEAFALLLDRHPEMRGKVRLTFLGKFDNDEIRESICLLQKSFGIESGVRFLGNVSDIGAYYAKATLLVITSRLEGAPMILTEAKSYALPTVMFKLPYVPGTNEAEGVVSVPMGDTFAMSEAIYDCLADTDRYQQLSTAAAASLDAYGQSRVLKRWKRVFACLSEGSEVEPCAEGLCEPDMLKTTMESIFNLSTVLCSARLHSRDRIERQLRQLREERDSVWKKLDGAWKMYNEVCQERDQVWKKLDEAWASKNIPEDYVVLQHQIRDLCAEKSRLETELGAVRHQYAGDLPGPMQMGNRFGECDGKHGRRLVWQSGDFKRGLTWPFRMTIAVCRSIRKQGVRRTVQAIPVKFVSLFNRFFSE